MWENIQYSFSYRILIAPLNLKLTNKFSAKTVSHKITLFWTLEKVSLLGECNLSEKLLHSY